VIDGMLCFISLLVAPPTSRMSRARGRHDFTRQLAFRLHLMLARSFESHDAHTQLETPGSLASRQAPSTFSKRWCVPPPHKEPQECAM
jgi:hypothetical protein